MNFLKPKKNKRPTKDDPFICKCNGVFKSEIIHAIKNGAKVVDEVYDKTNAGLGACGGTCRPHIKELINKENKS